MERKRLTYLVLVSMFILFYQHNSFHARLTKAFVSFNAKENSIFGARLAQGKGACITHVLGILLTVATKVPTYLYID